jgi:hypothetical protein
VSFGCGVCCKVRSLRLGFYKWNWGWGGGGGGGGGGSFYGVSKWWEDWRIC